MKMFKWLTVFLIASLLVIAPFTRATFASQVIYYGILSNVNSDTHQISFSTIEGDKTFTWTEGENGTLFFGANGLVNAKVFNDNYKGKTIEVTIEITDNNSEAKIVKRVLF